MGKQKQSEASLGKRKPIVDEVDEDEVAGEEEENEASEKMDGDGVEEGLVDLDVEFELKEPNKMFMDSVLMMMNHYGQGVIKDIFNLCNKILEDEYLTSCATMVGDETEGTGENMSITCYGFATLVNLSKYHNERFAKEILAFLKEKYGKAHASTYEQVAATKQKGLFIREKYYNLPDEVADTLLRQLKKDYRWVEEYEEDFEEDQYRFEKIICVLRCKKHEKKDAGMKKIKTDKNAEYLYYDDFERGLSEKAQNVIHIDLNLEPHNETDEFHVYNARAIVWIKTKDFMNLIPDEE